MSKKKEDEGITNLVILQEQFQDIVPMTAPPDRKEWLKQRRKGIGGSDAGAICGVDTYRTPYAVYLDKIGEGENDDRQSPHLSRGRKLEALVALEYLERHPEDSLQEKPMLTHPEHAWMVGNVDRVVLAPRHTTKGPGVLEIKAPARFTYERYKLNGLPPHYILQMQHYLAVTGYQWGVFAIFCADKWEMTLVEVERDEKLIADLIRIEEKFWNENVVPKKPPSETKAEERIKLPKTEGEVKSVDRPEALTAMANFALAQEQVKEAEAFSAAAKETLLEAIHQEPGVYDIGEHRVYYTAMPGRTTFDKKALVEYRPLSPLKVALALAEGDWPDEDIKNLLGQAELDLTQFEKKGNDFLTLRTFPAKTEKK